MTVQEMEQGFQRIWKLFEETDAKFKETRAQVKETSAQVKETSAQIKETRVMLEKTDKKIDALTGKWSKFVEGLVAPAVVKMFADRGIDVIGISQRVKRSKNGDGIEIDLLAINGEYAILIEAKSTLGVDDIKEHIERLGKFAAFFPEYQDRKVIGAVAGIDIDEGADKFGYRNGLFVIAQSGETVKILNDRKFTPKVW